MNNRLETFIENYTELEQGVQVLVTEQCRTSCGICTACCCRADICEEAVDSPFLRALHRQQELESDRYGFLCASGCTLPLGRPPVCYEFFCKELLEDQPDDLHRTLLKILGHLPAYAGERACDAIHLTELIQEDALDSLDFEQLETQMKNALDALNCIRVFYEEGTLPEDSQRILERISLVEE